jgi:diadenosine tetraphosphate (Ap4A) HIT family hydrolase
MAAPGVSCIICKRTEGDAELGRIQVWEDDLWRLTVGKGGEVLGFSYLEPKRHVPHITDLGGPEAATLGGVLAWACRALQEAADAQLVYIYVFGGGVPHLHIHLAPHRTGDALNESMIRGAFTETQLPSGATAYESLDYPPLPDELHAQFRERLDRVLRNGERR